MGNYGTPKKQLTAVGFQINNHQPTNQPTRTTPSFFAFLDEFSLAGNVSFVDDDLDRYEHLGMECTHQKKRQNVECFGGEGREGGGGNKRKPVEGGPIVINGIYTGYYIFLYKWPIVNG